MITQVEASTFLVPLPGNNQAGAIKLHLKNGRVKTAEFIEAAKLPVEISTAASTEKQPPESPDLQQFSWSQLALVMALENFLDRKIPRRASWLRTFFSELFRIRAHLSLLAGGFRNLGAALPADNLLSAHQVISRALAQINSTPFGKNLVRMGGFKGPLPTNFHSVFQSVLDQLTSSLQFFEKRYFFSIFFKKRTRQVGELAIEPALDWSLTGPCLRATGVNWDLRSAEPYFMFDSVDFSLPVGEHGDSYDRFLVRFKEIQQSLYILEQCLENIEAEGPLNSGRALRPLTNIKKSDDFVLEVKDNDLPTGEFYYCLEAPAGELGWSVESRPQSDCLRFYQRNPASHNYFVLQKLVEATSLADSRAIISSFDLTISGGSG